MRYFYSHSSAFLPKFSPTLQKYVNIVNTNTVEFIFETKKYF